MHGKPGECTQQTPNGFNRDDIESATKNKKIAKLGRFSRESKRKTETYKNNQPRNKLGRFISREMAERPRKANGQFKRKSTGGRR